MKYLFLIAMVVMASLSRAQFLFPESYVLLPLDTNKNNAGTVSGLFNSQTQRYVVTQIGARIELAHRIKKVNVLTVAGSFDLVQNGNQRVLSGGYMFARFRENITRKLFPEFMMQYQWFEVRGIQHKVAVTTNYRYRFVRTEDYILAAGAGLIHEYEKWGYTGVQPEKMAIITETSPVDVWSQRFNTYISYDHILGPNTTLDLALYYNTRLFRAEHRTRYGAHARVSFRISKHLTYRNMLRLMYEEQPVVPVLPLWYNFTNELVFSF